MKTELFSKGLYSTYLYVKEINSCFDCGEGMTTQLGPRCFGIRKLFISHGHHDHISGISSLIGARCVARGDNTAPLDIYYPENTYEIEELKLYIQKTRKPTFPLNWVTIKPESQITLDNPKRRVKAFKVKHTNNSLGYSIIEERKRGKPEYSNLTPKEFKALTSQGVQVSTTYWANLWSYTGDAIEVNPQDIKNTDWLFCDTTFLNPDDRKDPTHFNINEAIKLAKDANAKKLVGIHISPRYSNKERKEYEKYAQKEFPNSILLPFHKPITLENELELNNPLKKEEAINLG